MKLRRCSLFVLGIVAVMPGVIAADDKIPHSTTLNTDEIEVMRGTSKFIFKNQGEVEAEFRAFGFNPNPFGAQNRDEYLTSFGLPLLTTHVLVGAGKDEAAKEYQSTNCENAVGDNPAMISIIAYDQTVADKLNSIAETSSHARICVRVKGRDMKFDRWLLGTVPQTPEILDGMTKRSGGIDFENPLLLQDIRVIECDVPHPDK